MHKKEIIHKSSFLRGEELLKGILTANATPIGFEPVKTPEEWITIDRLYTVWAIGYHFGQFGKEPITDNAQIFFRQGDVSLQLSTHGFMICIEDGKTLVSDIHSLELKNGLIVLWHKKVTCLLVEKFINEVYTIAIQFGDIIQNQMQFREDSIIITKRLLSVDEIFSTRKVSGPYDQEVAEQEIFKCFDKPEELCFIDTEIGKWLTLKVNKAKQERMLQGLIEELKSQGTDLSKMESFDYDELLATREVMH